jgi:hypothetical protein
MLTSLVPQDVARALATDDGQGRSLLENHRNKEAMRDSIARSAEMS